MTRRLGRRDFLKAGAAAAAVMAAPLAARGAAKGLAVEKLRTAHIGVGGMGAGDLGAVSSHAKVEVAALCDVDASRLEQAKAKHAGAKTFRDYRELFAEMGDKIDAVVVEF